MADLHETRGGHGLGARVGLGGGTQLRSIDQVRTDVDWATSAGFDSYWVSHVVGVDPVVALAVAAAGDVGIEVGTSVVPTIGRHPIALAQQARTAQQACNGRFVLGVGPSHQIVAEAMYHEPWPRPFERTSEYLDALVPLCNGDAAAVDGAQIGAHTTLDVPCDPVPVVLAALGPRMLDLAGRVTAGTHVGQTGPRTIAEHTAPRIREAAADAARPEPRIIALVNLCVTDDPESYRQFAAAGANAYGSLPSYRAMLDREGIADPTDLLVVGSSADEIRAQLEPYVEAGATDLRLGILAPDEAHRRRTQDVLEEMLA